MSKRFKCVTYSTKSIILYLCLHQSFFDFLILLQNFRNWKSFLMSKRKSRQRESLIYIGTNMSKNITDSAIFHNHIVKFNGIDKLRKKMLTSSMTVSTKSRYVNRIPNPFLVRTNQPFIHTYCI